ncbi:MAG: hypothetical protein IJV63_01040 [Bacteroidales bacterium]|nr:hypothetical protein [Bacteroidales bacterium]
MRKALIVIAALCAVLSCKQAPKAPRPAIALVQSIVEDTTGIRGIVENKRGAEGAIALIGDPADVAVLSRRFLTEDRVDNVDGRHKPDSLPDFAGETIQAILDAFNAPYSHFLGEGCSTDSLREAAVNNALSAWDTTSFRASTGGRAKLRKASAKILIYTSSLQKEFGLFDVDTLLQLTGGQCTILNPVDILLQKVKADGARNIAVWAPQAVKDARIWEKAFGRRADATLSVHIPAPAVDIRNRFRDVLRQYQVTGLPLDALILDGYDMDENLIRAEIRLIRLGGTDEDQAFGEMLSKDFRIYNPADALLDSTYELLRKENLFTHQIAWPQVKYFETQENEAGEVVLVEVGSNYVKKKYVPELH